MAHGLTLICIWVEKHGPTILRSGSLSPTHGVTDAVRGACCRASNGCMRLAGPDGTPPCGSGSSATCCKPKDECCETDNNGVINACDSGSGGHDSGNDGHDTRGGFFFGRKLQTVDYFSKLVNGCSGGSSDKCQCVNSCGRMVRPR